MDNVVARIAEKMSQIRFEVDNLTLPANDLMFCSTLNAPLRHKLFEIRQKCSSIAGKCVALRFPKHVPANDDNDDEESDAFGQVVDLLDAQLENVDTLLDSMMTAASKEGRKDGAPANAHVDTMVAHVTLPSQNGKRNSFRVLHALNIARPQLAFADTIDNSNTPFVPRVAGRSSHFDGKAGEHPFARELAAFVHPPWVSEIRPPLRPASLESTKCTWIADERTFDAMLRELATVREIAVDLEHHNYRSFQGFTCIVQLSTRSADFVVDALACRSFMGRLLPLFTDATVVKVFHGADSDVGWLQRDFGLYIVNMYDTYFASRALGLSSHSLAHLLSTFAGVIVDKSFQLADWRIRPLPDAMLQYARSDTHHLLFLWDCVRNALLEKDSALYASTLRQSTALCGKLYSKELLNDDSWCLFAQKLNRRLPREQLFAIKALFEWRDHVARDQDESAHYVMPKRMLFRLAELLPTTVRDVCRAYFPTPPLVQQHAHDLVRMLRECKRSAAASADVSVQRALNVASNKRLRHIVFAADNEEGSDKEDEEEAVEEQSLSLRTDHMDAATAALRLEADRIFDVTASSPPTAKQPGSHVISAQKTQFTATETLSAKTPRSPIVPIVESAAVAKRSSFFDDDDDETSEVFHYKPKISALSLPVVACRSTADSVAAASQSTQNHESQPATTASSLEDRENSDAKSRKTPGSVKILANPQRSFHVDRDFERLCRRPTDASNSTSAATAPQSKRSKKQKKKAALQAAATAAAERMQSIVEQNAVIDASTPAKERDFTPNAAPLVTNRIAQRTRSKRPKANGQKSATFVPAASASKA